MIKFSATVNGRKLIGFGLSALNVERIKEGKPIYISLDEMKLPLSADVLIVYGETEEAILEEFTKLNLIGPDTLVNRAETKKV
jgi:hypothetical protein